MEEELVLLARDQASAVLNGVGAHLENMGAKCQRVGGMLSLGLTAPILAIGGGAIKMAAEFETAMNNVNSIAFLPQAQVKALGQEVINLSKTVPQGPEVLAKALYDIYSSGFQGSEALEVLTGAAQSASAGMTDAFTSGRALMAVMNAYPKGAYNAQSASDLLFQTVNLGVLSFEELATQIGDVLPTASATGVGLKDVGAAIATITRGGISASEATTALNQVMLSILDPGKAAAEMAADLGIDFSSSALASKGLAGVLEEVRLKTGGNIEEMAKLFPNVRALKGALSLTREEGKVFAEMLVGMGAASAGAGATQKALAEQSKSASFQFGILKNNVQALGITVGSALLPPLNDLMGIITPLIVRVSDFVSKLLEAHPAVGRVALILGGLLAALGPVLLIVGTLAPILGAAAAVLGVVAAALSTVLLPIVLIVAAVAGLALAWSKDFLGIRTTVTTWWAGVKPQLEEAATTLRDRISQGLTDLRTKWDEAWVAMQTGVTTWWAGVKPQLEEAAVHIGAKVKQAVDDLRTKWDAAWPAMQTGVTTWWAGVKPKLQEAVDWIGDKVGAAVKNLRTWFEENWPQMKNSVTDWWSGIKPALEGAAKSIGTEVHDAVDRLHKKFEPLIEIGKKVGEVIEKIGGLFEAFGEVIKAIKDKVGEWVEFGLMVLLGALLKIGNYLRDELIKHWDDLKVLLDAVGKFLEPLTKAFGDLGVKLDETKGPAADFSGVIDGIKGALDGISGAIDRAIGWLGQLADRIRNLPSPPSFIDPGSPTPFELALLGIGGAAGSAAEGLQTFIDALAGMKIEPIESVGKIASGLSGLLRDVREIATALSTEIPTVKLSVKPLLDGLRQIAQDVAAWMGAGGGSFAEDFEKNVLPKIESLVKSIGPVRELLDTGKSILEAAATPLPELKRSMETFLFNLSVLLTDIGIWIEAHKADWDKGVLWFRTEITPRLAALAEAIKPLGDLLSVGKSILEAAAAPLPELKRSMETFLRNLSILLTDIGTWIEAHKADWDAGVLWFKTEIAPRLAALNEAIQPLQSLLSTAKGILEITAAEVGEAKTSVETFLGALYDLTQAALNWYYAHETDLQELVTFFVQDAAKLLKEWAEGIKPLQDLLSVAKGILDIATAEVPEVKLAVDTFFDNLLGIMTSVGDWLGQDTNALSGVLSELLEYKDLFADWNVALQFLQPLLTATKSILELAASDAGAVEIDIAALFTKLTNVLQGMVGLASQIQTYAVQFTTEGIEKVTAFAGMIQAVGEALKASVQPLIDLANYGATPKAAIDSFFADLSYVIEKTVAEAAKWTATALTAAEGLAAAAQKVGKALQAAAVGLSAGEKGIGAYEAIARATVDAFFADLDYVVQKTIDTAALFTSQGLAAALDFALTAQEIGKALKDTAGGLKKVLDEVGADFQSKISVFLGGVAAIVQAVVTAATQGAQALASAREFAVALAGIVDAIGGAVQNFARLAGGMGGTSYDLGLQAGLGFVDGLIDGINALLPDLQAVLAYLASLFPHSPAERGPLAEPVNWAGYLQAGLPQALAGLQGALLGGLSPTLAPALIGGGGPGYLPPMAMTAPAAAAAGGGGVTLNIQNLYGTDREAAEKLTGYIAAELERRGVRF